ncbi:MAG: hypothetical protein KKH67_07560 [candidate division Zixibacteria bacterium]|nr:hypothetical protein [candidate division Zixibacteria bacterium]MBU1470349.1 hypothetical protein [candidate division Zixibacteria bacterium]
MNSNRATLVSVTFMLVVFATAFLSGCSEDTSQTGKTPNFVFKYEQDPELLEPLDVPVEKATDEWWFYDNFSFVGRISDVGNILMVAEIGRCLDPGGDPKVIKTFDMRFFDGLRWNSVGTHSDPDVITEMKTISASPQMSFVWSDSLNLHSRGSLRYRMTNGREIVMDFQNLLPLYGYSSEDDLKRSYDCGEGRLQIGDSVWLGYMFHEMINVRGNNKCEGNMPDFNPQNCYRLFGKTSGGKTIIASVDLNNDKDITHNSFFTLCDREGCQMAEGATTFTNGNANFRPVPYYEGGLLPHFVQIYSGDKINVQVDLWIDKDRYDPLADGWVRSGVFGNAVFWNRREKLWGILDHYQIPNSDTTALLGTMR